MKMTFIMPLNNSSYWQALQTRLCELAAHYPMMGIKPDSVALMLPDDLIGNYNFLSRHHAENEA
jgi:hypothetical protein